jgi:hypothetical protein
MQIIRKRCFQVSDSSEVGTNGAGSVAGETMVLKPMSSPVRVLQVQGKPMEQVTSMMVKSFISEM